MEYYIVKKRGIRAFSKSDTKDSQKLVMDNVIHFIVADQTDKGWEEVRVSRNNFPC